MLCDKCGQHQATVSYRSRVQDKEFCMYLCDHCAQSFDFSNLFYKQVSTADFVRDVQEDLTESAGALHCPVCHKSFADICNDGLVGCSHCYGIFAQKLEPTLQKLHGPNPHHNN